MKRLSSDKSKTLLIGDRLETDIAMGNKFGIDTALVSTGVKHYINGNTEIKPTYYLNSVADILNKKYPREESPEGMPMAEPLTKR